jgi:hypothetical protein
MAKLRALENLLDGEKVKHRGVVDETKTKLKSVEKRLKEDEDTGLA